MDGIWMGAISIAEELAKKQREISISEFFERNKHILGFDSLARALITSVKEGVDNALDACSDADILPEILVEVNRVGKDEYNVVIEDNGPGIVKKEVPNVFGRLLYGSRFYALKQTRGQQGIGISGAIMYAQLTTGKPSIILSKVKGQDVAYQIQLMIDTKKNRPYLVKEDFVIWEKEQGTRVELFLKGRYVTGKQSVYEYLKSTAIVNPHARIIFQPPEGERIIFERVTEDLPPAPLEIKPHPQGIELGTLLKMAKETKSYKMVSFLQAEFSRISYRVAREICDRAGIPQDLKPKEMTLEEAKAILSAISKVKIMAPPTDCLSPIGERLIRKGLKNVLGSVRPEFYCPPLTREPAVYSGNPFQVEVGIVYGGELPPDQPVEVLRYANRVPLLYQQGACALTAAVENVDWRRYGLEQRGGKGIPYGPAIILIHVASVKVPYTSESKEAIAPIPEIVEEIEKALKECGRRLRTHLNKKARKAKTREKFEIVQKILPRIAEKSARIVGKTVPDISSTITKIMDVVWIDESIKHKDKVHTVTLDIYNYTPTGKKFNLHAILPLNGHFDPLKANPRPSEVKEDGRVTWQLNRIPSTKRIQITFQLEGLDEGEYEETELYVSGINPLYVVGAEPLPGDWDLERIQFPEEEKVEEMGEVDYDEVEEVLDDE